MCLIINGPQNPPEQTFVYKVVDKNEDDTYSSPYRGDGSGQLYMINQEFISSRKTKLIKGEQVKEGCHVYLTLESAKLCQKIMPYNETTVILKMKVDPKDFVAKDNNHAVYMKATPVEEVAL